MDPWTWVVNEKIDSKDYKIDCPQMYIVSEGFGPEVKKVFEYDVLEYLKKLHVLNVNYKNELIMIKDINHGHQCDAIAIMPFEVCLRSPNTFQLNYCALYMLHSQLILSYLHRLGISNSFDCKDVNAYI